MQRYLSGRSVAESRLGLLFNGMFKVPMQFLILFIGVMVFVFYLFTPPPLFFNEPELERVRRPAPHAAELAALEAQYDAGASTSKRARSSATLPALEPGERDAAARGGAAARLQTQRRRVRDGGARRWCSARRPGAETQGHRLRLPRASCCATLPSGLVGLLIAVILCAAMSSTASELTALGSTTTVDFYQRMLRAATATTRHDAAARRKLFTVLWGAASRSASRPSPRCSTT